ncbi:MAG: GNAT family N-acetyltransferase [Deltaproteobacteria bacterium]|nr:GNAT family N-acetyltransferase [Deltaproteobacteria bacterium]
MHRLDQVCFDAPFSFERTTFDILLERPGAVSLAAVHPKQGVVGFIIVEPFSADATIVSTIDVHPDWRRRGIGRRLLHDALGQATARGLFKSYLQVYVGNVGAIAFYRRLGYRMVKLLPSFYGEGIDGYLMFLDFRTVAGIAP